MKKQLPDPELIDEVNPELTERQLRDAVPLSESFPALHAAWKQRGRPKKANPKREIKLRVDPDVLIAFKALCKGWQTQMNNALREWIAAKPSH